MDKLKIKIPRRILDLFLESNVANKAFDNSKGEPKKVQKNKFDDPKIENQDFNNYNLLRHNFEKREDLHGLFTKLKLDSKPFVPKANLNLDSQETGKNIEEGEPKKLSGIDPSQVKEFVPKNYKIVKKWKPKDNKWYLFLNNDA